MEKPKSISELDSAGVRGLFFDIDDTFTTDGKISSEAFQALWDLKRAGKIVVPLTGRPAGWCDHMARMWPVDAVVGENGAFYFLLKNGCMERRYTASLLQRDEFRRFLASIQSEILDRCPAAGIAGDQGFREFDLAIDYCEDVPRLDDRTVDDIVKIFKRYGASVKVSSIHINGWFGNYDKLTTAKRFAEEELGVDLEAENAAFVFVGDSPNDAPLFKFFEKSVGVANVMDFEGSIETGPAYIATGCSGAGFAGLAGRLLER